MFGYYVCLAISEFSIGNRRTFALPRFIKVIKDYREIFVPPQSMGLGEDVEAGLICDFARGKKYLILSSLSGPVEDLSYKERRRGRSAAQLTLQYRRSIPILLRFSFGPWISLRLY